MERVAKKRCQIYGKEEKEVSRCGNSEIVDVAVSYDMSWRKRGKAYDSSSGMGSAIGLKTEKVIAYATRNLQCRTCEQAEESQSSVTTHDCRRNYEGSSKSMDSNVAIQMFNEAPLQGMRFSTYVGDEDSTTESRLKILVDYDIEKCTLSSRLYGMKGKVKGMSGPVITYVQKCFGYAIKQNQNDAPKLKQSLELIIPHAFGDHDGCKDVTWCKFKDDPQNYVHLDLPGGKDLQGEDLRSALDDAMKPFLCEEAVKKLGHVGSTQRNKSLNGVIGFKNPKLRHYGGSESADFRTASGVAQFNDGHGYITDVCNELNLAPSKVSSEYVERVEAKRKNAKARRCTQVYKSRRNQFFKKSKTSKNFVTREARRNHIPNTNRPKFR